MRTILRQLRFRSEWLMSPRLRSIYLSDPDRAVLEEFRWKVAGGPFRGMKYITQSSGSTLAPKILGCYERELHPALDEVIAGDYDKIVDIGCAEGYYAVGLAWKMRIPVVAFDSAGQARQRLGELANLNGVTDLIDVRTTCGHDEFDQFSGQRVFLICDIEGGEGTLLDPEKAPALLGFDLLVEVHDGRAATALRDQLVARFADTHTIGTIPYEGRGEQDAKLITWIQNPQFRLAAVDEKRQRGLEWLHMKVRR